LGHGRGTLTGSILAVLPEEWLAELAAFLCIPSVSADPARAGDVRRAADWVAAYVQGAGGTAEVHEEGRLVVGEIPASIGPDAPTVLVYGHYDVQPPEPLDLWETDPFEATVRGEWLHARGVADDKGQLWMQLKAAEQLARDGTLPVTLRVICDGEEETGGDAIGRFVRADERGADAAVVLDGVMKQRGVPEFVLATRGLIAFDVEVQTGIRDLHSGQYGGTALNAIHALVEALFALFPAEGRMPDALRQGIIPPTLEELAAWRELPLGESELRKVGAPPLDERAAEEFYVRTWAEPSVDVNGIVGGKPGLRNTTLVSRASANLTIRLAPGQDVQTIAHAAESLLRDAAPFGTTIDVRWEGTPPGITRPDSEPVRLALDVFERVLGRRPLLVRAGGSLPLVHALQERGIPLVLAGLALPESRTHSANERMLLETFELGVSVACELYVAFAELRR
jgi:acetylornithine deacetylase/succinyl-diaminopimelate desuccinylase-like protein